MAYSRGRMRIDVHAWMAASFGQNLLPVGINYVLHY